MASAVVGAWAGFGLAGPREPGVGGILTSSVAGPTPARIVSPSPAASDAPSPPASGSPPPPSVGAEVAGPPRLIITAGGVVLPVLATPQDRWIVATPCGQSAALATDTAARLVERVDIVLDPGHGGPTEAGAVGANWVVEADVNLAVAQLAAARLEAAGYRVVLTRYGDYRLPIASRVAIANAVEAPIVSIHHNGGAANPAAGPGTQAIYRRDDAASRRLAGLIWEESIANLSGFTADWVAGGDAGATYRLDGNANDYYGIVREPTAAAVLTELSYIGNPSEAGLLATPEFLAAEARAIADGIQRWSETANPGSGFVEPLYSLTSGTGGGGLARCVDPPLD